MTPEEPQFYSREHWDRVTHVHDWQWSIRDGMRWCACGVEEWTFDEVAEDARAILQGRDPA